VMAGMATPDWISKFVRHENSVCHKTVLSRS
jgi:hypothetical protein